MTHIMRVGKTARDKKTGSWHNRFQNKVDRDAWRNSPTGVRSNKNFPSSSCNGKKNRSVVTAKRREKLNG